MIQMLLFVINFHSKAADINFEKNKKKDFLVTVAVIDTGLDTKHLAFENKLWTNAGEKGLDRNGNDKSNNGVDDDQNGYVDDIHGWNFVKNSNDLSDEIGHGTHISGLIVKKDIERKNIGTSDQPVRLMVLKYFDPASNDFMNLKRSNLAIQYAIKMKAHLINYSGGGTKSDPMERDLIYECYLKNILFVAAAGNNSTNIDLVKFYPASYNFPNIIAVAALDRKNQLAKFSNFGSKTIDVAAQGSKLLSTLPDNKYGFMSGTSQATAVVSGEIANWIGHNPAKPLRELTIGREFEPKTIQFGMRFNNDTN